MKTFNLELHCEWGLDGLVALAPFCQVLIIVDVLSFCTCVDIAVSRGALILPFGGFPDMTLAGTPDAISAEDYAQEKGALLARLTPL